MESGSKVGGPDCKRPRLIWKNEDMEKAIEAVKSKEKSISAASKKFNVPRKTLDDRIKGRVKQPGVCTALTFVQEKSLVQCCVSAAGFPLPPMIIYAKSFPGQYRFDGPEDSLYAKSDSGWLDSELFLAWLKKIFVKFCVPQRPIMLLVDGHVSHITIEAIDFCQANNIIIFCLPPHTTHALQPLDVAFFKSLKDKFSKAIRSLSFTKKNFVVTKREFSKVLRSPFDHAFSIANIKSGFSKCGIYPFNPDAVPLSKMKPSTLYGTSSVGGSPATSAADETTRPPVTTNPSDSADEPDPMVEPDSADEPDPVVEPDSADEPDPVVEPDSAVEPDFAVEPTSDQDRFTSLLVTASSSSDSATELFSSPSTSNYSKNVAYVWNCQPTGFSWFGLT